MTRGISLYCAAALAAGVAAGAGDGRETARSPWDSWQHGPPSDPGYFPIAVWLQDPRNAKRYQSAAINLYIGLGNGPTDQQLIALKAAGMLVICEQNDAALAHRSDPIIAGWMHGDEPDNAQPVRDAATGRKSYGPPVPPPRVVAEYERMRAADPTRPILLNLGQGVANDDWKGRGPEGRLEDYRTYVKGGDVISFDVYPVAGLERPDGENHLWYVAKGVERLRQWTGGGKIVWNCIECTRISSERARATPLQVRAEVWMSLIHGSTGIIWFVHQFKPRFNEWALLDDPEMLAAVTAINRQIREMAPVLNSPTVSDGASVRSSASDAPIAARVKRHGGATYLFAVGMRNAPARGTFAVRGLRKTASAEVIGEGRRIAVRDGRFEDAFKPYDVHLYQLRP